MPESTKSQLPSPFAVFATDPHLEKFERIAAVEKMLLNTYGANHVPQRTTEGEYFLGYFRNDTDAMMQRKWCARRIVELEIIEEARAEFLAAEAQPHGRVLFSLRAAAEHQMEQYRREGQVTVTGYEDVEVA